MVADLLSGGERDLTVAVTGPTGTFGFGLMPLLQADHRVARVVGIARRPFDPAGYGWTKMEYRRGDVRDPEVLRDVFGHADVAVHLAFLVTGAASGEAIWSINVEGTLNAFGAAAAGARRFVYASSVAAYGFHRDNPVGIVTAADIARELGMLPLPVPAGPTQPAARAIAALPFLPPVAQWVEAVGHPAIMDTTRAKQKLGWVPRFTAGGIAGHPAAGSPPDPINS
jgi:nucleoside-diphosphate-sugar epimerase